MTDSVDASFDDCRKRRSRAVRSPDRGEKSLMAQKWRRNPLKNLNPRPEMAWTRKPRTHNIW
jgi:hypothetical protein